MLSSRFLTGMLTVIAIALCAVAPAAAATRCINDNLSWAVGSAVHCDYA